MAGIIVYPLFTLATVPNGGTGATSFTANGVLYGNGTAALQVTAQGAANSILTANAGAPSFSQTPIIQTSLTIGVAGSATGTLLLRGTTSGTVTTTVAAAAGTWTFTLPTGAGTANYVMSTDGAGVASWVSGQSIAGLLTSSTPQFARLGLGAAADAAAPLLTSRAQGVGNNHWTISDTVPTERGSIGIRTFTNSSANFMSLKSQSGLEFGTGDTLHQVIDSNGLIVFGANTTDSTQRFAISGSAFSPSATGQLFFLNQTINAAVSSDAYGFRNNITIGEASSGVHALLALNLFGGAVTAGVATTTNLVNVEIQAIAAASGTTTATGLRVAAPTGATNNFAINITSGDIYKAGTAYNNPDYALEMWATGKIDKFAKNEGANLYRAFTLQEIRNFSANHFYLPQLDFFNAHTRSSGGFQRADISLLLHEDTYRFLFQHEDMITVLAGENLKLQRRIDAFEQKRQ